MERVSVAVRGDPGDDGPADELIVAGTAFGTVQLLSSCLSLISFHVFRLRVIQSRVFSSSQESAVSNLISRRTIALFGLIQFCRSVVGIFGFKHDRQLALQALAASAEKSDVHSVFAGCVTDHL